MNVYEQDIDTLHAHMYARTHAHTHMNEADCRRTWDSLVGSAS